MSFQLNTVAVLLAVLILLGIFAHNTAVTVAAAVLLVMQQTLLSRFIPWVDKYGISLGIIILTIGVLSPLVSGKVKITGVSQFANWQMIAAVLVGILVAWLGGRGVPLMRNVPAVVPGLILGTVIGVAFLKGVPVGPLIAAGILSLALGTSGDGS